MKRRILLIDESLTVQKVVSLTLDKNRYQLSFAKSRAEAIQQISSQKPELILVSDQVSDLSSATFPKEVEAWLGGEHLRPPIVLISGQEGREARHYTGVLKKPFSPQALTSALNQHLGAASSSDFEQEDRTPPPVAAEDEADDQRFQKMFNDTFNDEARLVAETLNPEEMPDEVTQVGVPVGRGKQAQELWGSSPGPGKGKPGPKLAAAPPPSPGVLGPEDSMAYKAVLEREVEEKLEGRDLDAIVDKLLAKMVPPIVERLVQERLDQLLKEQESFVDIGNDPG